MLPCLATARDKSVADGYTRLLHVSPKGASSAPVKLAISAAISCMLHSRGCLSPASSLKRVS
ncbi:MAG: hypothetical protein DRN96_08565 [Thermoproteota archaeon]|nr:MAG: hypothetical protein DRN96_08565 [Candidatus Korarchaeota archaeon]